MRTAEKVWSGIGAAVFGLVGITAMSPSTAASTPLALDRPAAEAPARSTTTITGVVDGDTLLAGQQVIHVLGIDSCDASTPGGAEATRMAEALLDGRQVTLRAEPGVDRDASGRMLRYIDLAQGGDYGDFMVSFAHTRADASNGAGRQYVSSLRDDDSNGRTCG
ncbi:thermonuclease family protein [Actinomycetospora termitidis]|uniref:Thermonuclease family protein n=1 Tax=Actinomycetospora termitidis TaxID=3053470 RepID=A0ABT7MHF1_9PSEU|nr:thermonuclease family protein [Actinomycetospora sp. Odt1-22]MDL5159599.1 thermonuclease family protein [Actinomycetospora sp. Odt1-22]